MLTNNINQRRLETIKQHLVPSISGSSQLEMNQTSGAANPPKTVGASTEKRFVEVKDSQTGKTIKINVEEGNAIRSVAFEQLDLVCLDPGFLNTAISRSSISYIDGDKGILRYRGYDIEELAEKASFLEVAFLLINGDLPDKNQLGLWEERVMKHTYLHENMTTLLKQFRYDAHPVCFNYIISNIGILDGNGHFINCSSRNLLRRC